jgi:8-oxo-dGTP diphosphatase
MDNSGEAGRFLGMVGGLIWCPGIEKYLILKRSADKDFAEDTWECGTGRVDQGENFSQALRRELKEELGVDIIIDFIIGTTHFYRGKNIPENEMLGVFYLCSLDDHDSITLSWEHSEFLWVTPDEVDIILPSDYWLTRLIHRGDKIRSMLTDKIHNFFLVEGFEL